MAWYDIPNETGDADYPLSAWTTTTVQNNISQAFAQSAVDHPSAGDGGQVEYTVPGTDWKSLALGNPAWVPMPIPLRYKRGGEYRDIDIDVRAYCEVSDVSLRAYLLPARAVATTSVDDTNCIVGTDAYDGVTVTAGGWAAYSFATIVPEAAEILHGQSVHLHLPFVWLHFFVRTAGTNVVFKLESPRYTEVIT